VTENTGAILAGHLHPRIHASTGAKFNMWITTTTTMPKSNAVYQSAGISSLPACDFGGPVSRSMSSVSYRLLRFYAEIYSE